MHDVGQRELTYDNVEEGEEFGPLYYTLTSEKLDAYRQAVGDPTAVLATIASKDYSYLLHTKYRRSNKINAKYEVWFEKAPVVGNTIEARGRVVEKYVKRERQYVVIETTSKDESGHDLVRSRTTLVVGRM